MPNLNRKLAKHTTDYKQRIRKIFTEHDGSMAIVDDQSVINFCSNDYLNLSTHDEVKQTFAKSAANIGLGSTGSALISGYSKSHARLENAFAEFLERDRAILFNSGYHANLGVMTTFADRESTIIADKYCHASLIDGALLSRAKLIRYPHNDLKHAEKLLEKHAQSSTLLVSESVFSMQGSLTNIPYLSKIANKNNSLLIIDDAHGLGILGKKGAGASDYFQLSQEKIPCLVSPLGKAIGSYGAIVSGDSDLIEALLQFAGSYRYCTALPPAVCDATLSALNILKKESWRREKLSHLCAFFLKECAIRNIILSSNDVTPIMSVIIGCNQKTLIIQQRLLDHGLLVSCIRPPTVPKNKACLRISLNCMHEENQIIFLLDHLKELLNA